MQITPNFSPWTDPTYSDKIILSNKNTIIQKIPLDNFEINQTEFMIEEKYRFIDLEKLNKVNGKKYTIAELRDIAIKLKISLKNKKGELIKLIKLKIGIE